MKFIDWLVKEYPNESEWVTIKVLDCQHNNLTTLNGIEKLTNLQILDCQNNSLTELEGVVKLTNLQVLECGYNNFIYPFKVNGIKDLNKVKKYHLLKKLKTYSYEN